MLGPYGLQQKLLLASPRVQNHDRALRFVFSSSASFARYCLLYPAWWNNIGLAVGIYNCGYSVSTFLPENSTHEQAKIVFETPWALYVLLPVLTDPSKLLVRYYPLQVRVEQIWFGKAKFHGQSLSSCADFVLPLTIYCKSYLDLKKRLFGGTFSKKNGRPFFHWLVSKSFVLHGPDWISFIS